MFRVIIQLDDPDCRLDGDGMLHACRIRGGKVSYSNLLVKTHKLLCEQKAGAPVFSKV